MGALTVERWGPSWWAASGALVVAGATMAAVLAAGEVHAGPPVVAVAAVAALVLGAVVGAPGLVTTSACLQICTVAWTARLTDAAPSAATVVVALAVWSSFELGLTSLELRGPRTTTTDFWWARVADGIGLAAVGGVVAVVALAVSGSGPSAEALVLRAGGLAVVAGVVVGLLLLSRRLRRG